MPAVHAEKGCHRVRPAIDADPALPFPGQVRSDTFLAIEKWESMDALKAHAAAPHMKAYGEKTRDWLRIARCTYFRLRREEQGEVLKPVRVTRKTS